jgi:hypothetical protein
MTHSTFKKAERYLFLLVIIINLLPLFHGGFFLTLDGPSHLYNGNLIFSLISGDNPMISHYFCFNTWNYTNWTGHFLLGFLNLFLPAWMAEKTILALILIFLPLAFRSFVKTFSPDNLLMTWIIFPLTWSQFLYNGFYNFLIGIIIMLVIFRMWIRPGFKKQWVSGFFIFLLLLLTALSHVFVFLLTVAIITGGTLWETIIDLAREKKGYRKKIIRTKLKALSKFFLFSIPGFIILIVYVLAPTKIDNPNLIVSDSLLVSLNSIRIGKPMIALLREEQMFTAKWFYWICLMLVVAWMIRWMLVVRDRKRTLSSGKRVTIIKKYDFLLISALLFIALFVIYDHWFEKGFYINDRFLFAAFLCLSLWIAIQHFPRWFSVLSIVMALTVNFGVMILRQPLLQYSRNTAQELVDVSRQIEPGGVVYPLNFSGNWLYGHIISYLGAEKDIVILDNYESEQVYFPLSWKEPDKELLKNLNASYPNVYSVMPDGQKAFDYILSMAENEAEGQEDFTAFKMILDSDYEVVTVSASGYIKLYKHK